MYEKLFSELQIGSLLLKNRIIFTPIATNLAAVSGEVTPEFIYHYKRRAKGGAAIVTLENMCIQYPDARHGATQPRIDEDKFIPGLSRVAYAVHSYGSLTFMELTHPGLFSNITLSQGKTPIAPSRVNLRPDRVMPRELSEEEIEALANTFAEAALRAKKAHFDGVEIEAAHGLLVNQFLSPLTNNRKDRFGGSIENRVRFPQMILEKIKERCGNDFPVTARIGVIDFIKDGITIEEGAKIARIFGEVGYAAVHADVGFGDKEKRLEPMQYPEAWRSYLAEELKKQGVNIPVIAVGMIRNPSKAEEILREGKADLIGLGRTLIADPDWPIKAESGREKEIKRCIGCNECIKARHEEGTSLRCGTNPAVGKLESIEILPLPLRRKRVLVIGAGIAGLEASVTLKKRGHNVTVWEKEKYIGGVLKLGAVPPGKEKILWLIEYYEHMLEKMNIPVQLQKRATIKDIEAFDPDVLIVATGSNYNLPRIKGIGNTHVVTFKDILKGDLSFSNKKVVVGGGGLVGCETALYLQEKGNDVTIIEMLPDIAIGMEPITRNYLLRELKEKGVEQITSAPIKEIRKDSVIFESSEGKNKKIEAERFVAAFGGYANFSLYRELKNKFETYLIGDAIKPGKIIDAVHTGYSIGRSI